RPETRLRSNACTLDSCERVPICPLQSRCFPQPPAENSEDSNRRFRPGSTRLPAPNRLFRTRSEDIRAPRPFVCYFVKNAEVYWPRIVLREREELHMGPFGGIPDGLRRDGISHIYAGSRLSSVLHCFEVYCHLPRSRCRSRTGQVFGATEGRTAFRLTL